MKAIIIAGISLFAAATIYGVTDFAADKKSGAIDKLYKEETAAPAVEESETPSTTAAAKEEKTVNTVTTETAAKKTTAKKKIKRAPKESIRFIKAEDFSRGRIRPKEAKEEVIAEPVVKTENKE